jgi:hypothetical protein
MIPIVIVISKKIIDFVLQFQLLVRKLGLFRR